MCGIVSYVGGREAFPIIVEGLKRLEYRGYDSAGIAVMDGAVKTFKKKGRVKDLEDHVKDADVRGRTGNFDHYRGGSEDTLYVGLLDRNPGDSGAIIACIVSNTFAITGLSHSFHPGL